MLFTYAPIHELELMYLPTDLASQADRERWRDLAEVVGVYLETAIKFMT